jgi:hypothetical protein
MPLTLAILLEKELPVAKQRFIRSTDITVEKCVKCGKPHNFPIEILFDRETEETVMTFGLFEMFSSKPKFEDFRVECPEKKEEIVISVPITLSSSEELKQIRLGKDK